MRLHRQSAELAGRLPLVTAGGNGKIVRVALSIIIEIMAHYVREVCNREIEDAIWAKSLLNEEINDQRGIWLHPLRSIILNSQPAIGAMTRSAAIKTQ